MYLQYILKVIVYISIPLAQQSCIEISNDHSDTFRRNATCVGTLYLFPSPPSSKSHAIIGRVLPMIIYTGIPISYEVPLAGRQCHFESPRHSSHNAVSTTKCSWIHYCKMHTNWHSDLRSTKQAASTLHWATRLFQRTVAIDDDFRVILTLLILAVDRHWWQFSLRRRRPHRMGHKRRLATNKKLHSFLYKSLSTSFPL
jgi:hypothetical protein